jgi:probable HAF family extracellular repeat protein
MKHALSPLAFMLLLSNATAFTQYEVIPVTANGFPNYGYTRLLMNDSRQVVGGNSFWDNGSITPIIGVSWPERLNNAGQVVGRGTSGGQAVGVVWKAGILRTLPALAAGQSSFATAINENGDVVGYSDDSASSSIDNHRATLWQAGGGAAIDLGTYGTDFASRAYAINGQGVIAAVSLPANGSGFGQEIFVIDGMARSLIAEYLTGDQSIQDINDNGTVVGYINSQAFWWNAGEFHQFSLQGNLFSNATGINDREQIVGYGSTDAGLQPFILEGSMLMNLNDLIAPGDSTSYPLELAHAINEGGDILVTDTQNNVYILVPIPEPSTYAAITGGLALVGVAATRRRRQG